MYITGKARKGDVVPFRGKGFLRKYAHFSALNIIVFCLFFLVSCSRIGDYAEKRADKAAYEIISQKQKDALGEAANFTLERSLDPETVDILARARKLEQERDSYTTPTTTISLAEAMAIAVANNRDYQSRRESFYSQALSLTETRRDFHTLFEGSGSASVTRSETGNDQGPGDETVEWFGSRGASAGVSKLLATGARVSLDVSHSFIRYFTDDANPSSANDLSFSIAQPLLRGAGSLTVKEGLRQAERSMIYETRNFRRYQQSFIIEVASRYYSLLSSRDQLRNADRNYESTLFNLQKLRELSGGGKVSSIEVDQARQSLLQAELRLTRTAKNYAKQLDQFKIFLGVPMNLDIGPNPEELKTIRKRGLLKPDMTLSEAVDIALEDRLDFKNTHDAIEDAQRSVKIALRNFLPNLDFSYSYSTSTSDEEESLNLDFRDSENKFSLNLGLPFDWTPRRNEYRNSLIGLDQALRNVEESRQNLILEVRDAWRDLEESRTEYRIQMESVRLAQDRVTMASMFLQSGRSTARDLLEAEDALLASRNALTNALVQHTLLRMKFWNTIERFNIDERGLWAGIQNSPEEKQAR